MQGAFPNLDILRLWINPQLTGACSLPLLLCDGHSMFSVQVGKEHKMRDTEFLFAPAVIHTSVLSLPIFICAILIASAVTGTQQRCN